MRNWVLSAAACTAVMAGGYKIPENSLNSTALSAAYVASSHGADAAYYNPAAMVHNENVQFFEVDSTYIRLTPIEYNSATAHIRSKEESFVVPSLHYTSASLGENGARVGFSIVSPAGLSKRWDALPASASAEEFTLKTVEFNPSFALPLSEAVSLGIGFRVLSSEGVVKSTAAVSRNMEGSSIDYGYNLALMAKPTRELSLAATYRSKIDLSIEGSAKLYAGSALVYNSSAGVSVPVPAALNLAAAYTFESGTTVEALYERTYWSAYQNLDFHYASSIGGLTPYFDAPVSKRWEDTSTYRLGLTQKYDRWTAMAGVAYDETPVPESTLGYELPDSDAWMVSLGGRYQIARSWNIGLAGLVDMKKDREVHNGAINGEFSNGRAYLATAGIEYRF